MKPCKSRVETCNLGQYYCSKKNDMCDECAKKNYNKYKNKWTKCNQEGHKPHQSAGEAKYCNQLALMVKGKIIKSYETQVNFDLKVNGYLICKHKVDFVVETLNNKAEIHEFKGTRTPDWEIKYKLIRALYPGIPYKIIEYKDL